MQSFSNTIISAADFHLSSNHFKYLQKPFEFFINKVKEEKPLFTILNGDIFDTRINADEDIYHYTIQNIINLSFYTKYLIVIDGTYSHDYNTLDILNIYSQFIPNIYFIKTKTVITLDNIKFLFLPEEYPENKVEFYQDIFSDKYDYIFGHGDIEGAVFHSGADNSLLKGFKFNKLELSKLAKYIVFGHFHKHQFLKDNLLYIGSLGRFKFGEEEDKGFIEIKDIKNNNPSLTFIKTPCIDMNTIKIEDKDNLLSILEEAKSDSEIKIKIPKLETLDEDLIKKIEEFKGSLKIDYILDKNDNIEDILEYKDIEKMDVLEQFKFMLKYEIENSKISKKNQKFFNEEVLEKFLNNVLKKD